MNAQPCDAPVRADTTVTARRRVLTMVGGSALAGLVSALGVSPAPARAAPSKAVAQKNQGNQSGAAINNAGQVLFTNAVAKKLAESGAGWVHINFRLGAFANWKETTSFGYSALSLYDKVIANARNNNLKVLGLLSNEAWQGYFEHWQAGSVEVGGGNGSNGYIEDYARHAAGVVAPYFAGRVDAWEIWNEPNLTGTYMYPSNFAQLLAQSYTAVKQAGATNAKLISGGIASQEAAWGAITSASSGADYLTQTYARGRELAGPMDWDSIKAAYGAYPLDDIGQHIYIDGSKATTSSRIDTALSLLRNAYVQAEGGSTPKMTHITEMGWATNRVSESIQATNLETAYARFRTTSYVQRAYWFFLRDEPPAGLYFGLLRSNGTAKPAWKSYQTFANY
jgi:hypothetical protein